MSCLLGLNPRFGLDSYLKIETNTAFFTVSTDNKDPENKKQYWEVSGNTAPL